LNSFVSVQPPVNAMPSQRLTVRPRGSFSTNVASRVFLTRRLIVERLVPGDVFPVIGSGTAHLRLGEPPP